MSKHYNQFVGHYERMPIVLFAEINIGAAGAPSFNERGSQGFESISRVIKGKYNVVLYDSFQRVISTNVTIKYDGNPGVYSDNIQAETIATDRTVQILVRDSSGIVADPPDGTTLLLKLWLSDHPRIGES